MRMERSEHAQHNKRRKAKRRGEWDDCQREQT